MIRIDDPRGPCCVCGKTGMFHLWDGEDYVFLCTARDMQHDAKGDALRASTKHRLATLAARANAGKRAEPS